MSNVYTATAYNQYGRVLGRGTGATRETAKAEMNADVAHTLSQANPSWKWRVKRVKVALSAPEYTYNLNPRTDPGV